MSIRETGPEDRWRLRLPGEIRIGEDESGSSATLSLEEATDQNLREQTLSEEVLCFHSAILENLAEAVHVTIASSGVIAFTNPQLDRLFGYDPGELVGKPMSVLHAPGDKRLEDIATEIVNALSRDGVWQGEVRHLKKDGTPFWCQAVVKLVHLPRYGDVYISSHRDITDWKQSEQALRETNDLFSQFMRHSPIYAFIKDVSPTESRTLQASDNYLEMIGIPGYAMVGKTMDELFPAEFAAKITADDWTVVSKGEVMKIDEDLNGRHYTTIKFPLVQGARTLLAGYTIDVTERKQSEKALREVMSRLQLATASARIGVWDWDIQAGTMLWDDRMLELYGKTRAEMLGTVQDWKNGLHPEDLGRAVAECEAALRGEAPFDTEFRVQHKNGDVLWLKADALIMRDAEGKPIRMIGLNRDVTERVHAKQALAESEEVYRAIFEQAAVGMVRVSMDGFFIRANPRFCEFTGYAEAELQTMTFLDITHPDDREASREYVQGLLDGTESVITIEKRYVHKEGHVIWGEVTVSIVRTPDGTIRSFLTVVQDITEFRQAQAALKESEARFKDLLDNIEMIGVMLDTQGRITYCNDYLSKHTGWTREELLGEFWLDLFIPQESREEILQIFFSRVQKREIPPTFENTILLRSGERRLIRWTNIVLNNTQGEIVGTASLGEDITEQREAAAKILNLNVELDQRVKDRTAQLENANQELEAFSYSVSHDLRTPLRSIDGFCQALEQDCSGQLNEEGQHYLHRIRAGAERMSQLIDDLLKLSRLGRQEMKFHSVDLSAIARKVFEDHVSQEPERTVIWHVEEGLEALADASLMRVALENLISNAWKFSAKQSEARIEFSLHPMPDGQTAFSISDNGVGFNMAYAKQLFGPFQRLHAAKDFPGSGIGLATVQRIIHRHGGKIWAESAPDEGATFFFTLS